MILELTAKKPIAVDDEMGYPRSLHFGDIISYDVDSLISDMIEKNSITAYKAGYPLVTFILDDFSFDVK